MPSTNRNHTKQVRLTVFDSEPLARLAEQRLWKSGIPCLIRSLHGGPGLWGSAYNLPHDLCVYESDEAQARQVLGLPDRAPEEKEGPRRGTNTGLWLVVIVIAVVVALFLAARAV